MSYPPESAATSPSSQPKLLDQVRDRIRRKGYSIRTEKSYAHWIKRFILFHDKRHPKDMGAAEVEAFLTSLAVDADVAAATQNLALSECHAIVQGSSRGRQPGDRRSRSAGHRPRSVGRRDPFCPVRTAGSRTLPAASA